MKINLNNKKVRCLDFKGESDFFIVFDGVKEKKKKRNSCHNMVVDV